MPGEDTLPEWLHNRFARTAWSDLSDADRSYWEHEAAAVRRAVARDGFKDEGENIVIGGPGAVFHGPVIGKSVGGS